MHRRWRSVLITSFVALLLKSRTQRRDDVNDDIVAQELRRIDHLWSISVLIYRPADTWPRLLTLFFLWFQSLARSLGPARAQCNGTTEKKICCLFTVTRAVSHESAYPALQQQNCKSVAYCNVRADLSSPTFFIVYILKHYLSPAEGNVDSSCNNEIGNAQVSVKWQCFVEKLLLEASPD